MNVQAVGAVGESATAITHFSAMGIGPGCGVNDACLAALQLHSTRIEKTGTAKPFITQDSFFGMSILLRMERADKITPVTSAVRNLTEPNVAQ
jgi:hypothetical protein